MMPPTELPRSAGEKLISGRILKFCDGWSGITLVMSDPRVRLPVSSSYVVGIAQESLSSRTAEGPSFGVWVLGISAKTVRSLKIQWMWLYGGICGQTPVCMCLESRHSINIY